MLNLSKYKFKNMLNINCFKNNKLRSDFSNREQLVNLLPSELRDKVRCDIRYGQTTTDEILGIDEIWFHGNHKLIVKQELYIEDIDGGDYYLFKDDHVDGKLYYIDIGVVDLELIKTKFFKFDDYENGVPKSVWVLVEDILEGYKNNYIPYMI